MTINKPILKVILPLLHINRNITRITLYSPLNLGGFGLESPYMAHINNVIKTCLRGFRTKTTWTALLVISLRTIQLAIGTINHRYHGQYHSI